MRNFSLDNIMKPQKRGVRIPVTLTERTMQERLHNVILRMKEEQLDVLIIYGDLEHGSNFEYLTGFLPRFEEGILVLHQDGKAWLLLGNENTKMVKHSRIPAGLIHVPFFSLPNQPMIAGDNRIKNSSHLFIGDGGVRTTNNANEIAHYEFGAALAGDCISDALEYIRPGITEMELGEWLNRAGQRNSVVTIASTGERFENANLYPGAKTVKTGDRISLTAGYKGGLSSRAGYAVETEEQLPDPLKDYVEKLAGPYFAAVIQWLETIHIGMAGGELYEQIQEVLPREEYGWQLNPGHLTADEEWMSSPVYKDSKEVLRSGMILQIDIIPQRDGYGGAGCESGIALADKTLRKQIQREYPELYQVFLERRRYITDVLHINISEEVLPMSDIVAYYRPYFLNHRLAFVKRSK